MKVAYLSNYRDRGYTSSFAIDNILSLDAAGVNVVSRPISLSGETFDLTTDMGKFENGSLSNVDAVIQHIPPNFYEKKGGVKNIGFFYWDQSFFGRSMMEQCCNLLDELWVPCLDAHNAARKSGVTIPIFICKHGRDSKRFKKTHEPFDIPILQDKLVYYTIADLALKKNISGLIRAYYAAFNKHDQVHLLLQLSCSNPQEEARTRQLSEKLIADLKKATNIYSNHDDYPKISIMCEPLNDKKISRIHATGDVFVSCDRGDSWNVFLHDAMGFGNPVVCGNICGQRELVSPRSMGFLVDGQETPCLTIDGEDQTNSGKEFWFDPNIRQFAEGLIHMYSRWQDGEIEPMRKASRKSAAFYDYGKVGSLMKTQLEKGN